MLNPPREDAGDAGRFVYFMVRVRINAPGEPASFAGMVERLGTGRKRSFPDARELLRLLTDWSAAPSKMPPQRDRINEEHPIEGGAR